MAKSSQKGPYQKKAPRIATDALPRKTLQDAVRVAQALFDNVGAKSATWDELAGYLTIGTQSNDTKYLFWSAQAYGVITRAEDKSLSLSETGRKIVAPNDPDERLEALRKAVLTPTILSKFFSDYNGHPIPAEPHFSNVLLNKYSIPKDRTEEAIKLITANGVYSQILLLAEDGSQPTVKLDRSAPLASSPSSEPPPADAPGDEATADVTNWDKEVFYITPIGDEGTEARKHSDMMLNHLIKPVCQEFGLEAIRADKIAKSGLINQQVFGVR